MRKSGEIRWKVRGLTSGGRWLKLDYEIRRKFGLTGTFGSTHWEVGDRGIGSFEGKMVGDNDGIKITFGGKGGVKLNLDEGSAWYNGIQIGKFSVYFVCNIRV